MMRPEFLLLLATIAKKVPATNMSLEGELSQIREATPVAKRDPHAERLCYLSHLSLLMKDHLDKGRRDSRGFQPRAKLLPQGVPLEQRPAKSARRLGRVFDGMGIRHCVFCARAFSIFFVCSVSLLVQHLFFQHFKRVFVSPCANMFTAGPSGPRGTGHAGIICCAACLERLEPASERTCASLPCHPVYIEQPCP
jgi:hypothetical protein